MLNSSKVLSSVEQQEIDSALTPLLPNLPPADRQEAFPAADLDMHSVAQQLDSQIAPAGKCTITCHMFSVSEDVERLAAQWGASLCANYFILLSVLLVRSYSNKFQVRKLVHCILCPRTTAACMLSHVVIWPVTILPACFDCDLLWAHAFASWF